MTDDATSSSSSSRQLAQRAVDSLMNLCRRGNRLGVGFLLVVILVCGTSFALGYAATNGGTQVLWVIVGGIFLVAAVGFIVAALLALRHVSHSATKLLGEVQQLLDGDVVEERVIIDTVEAADAVEGESALVLSRQFSGLQTAVVKDGRTFPAVMDALSATVRFPGYLAMAALITLVFAVLAPLFLLSIVL